MAAGNRGRGVLAILVGTDPKLTSAYEEDLYVYRESGVEVTTAIISSVGEIKKLISNSRPEVVHLVAEITPQGSILDSSGDEVTVKAVVSAAEGAGASLFTIASEVEFDFLKHQLPKPRSMNQLIIIGRNRHFATFLRGLLKQLSSDPNFALAFVTLAPQHDIAQRNRPLPGAIACCPAEPNVLVLWSEAQP